MLLQAQARGLAFWLSPFFPGACSSHDAMSLNGSVLKPQQKLWALSLQAATQEII